MDSAAWTARLQNCAGYLMTFCNFQSLFGTPAKLRMYRNTIFVCYCAIYDFSRNPRCWKSAKYFRTDRNNLIVMFFIYVSSLELKLFPPLYLQFCPIRQALTKSFFILVCVLHVMIYWQPDH